MAIKKRKKLRESEDEMKQKHHEAEDEHETESEDDGATESEDEHETESEDEDGEGGDDDHADKDKDVALIKKMIADHLGDGAKSLTPKQHEAMMKFGKQSYQAYQDMGHSEDEAYKCAGSAMKLAHHMASKEDESEHEAEDGDSAPPPPKKKVAPKGKGKPATPAHDDDGDDDDDGASSESDENESEGKKESNVVKKLRKELLEAEGRIAALEVKDRKVELDRYIEAAFKKSGQPVSITKRFREAAGKLKSKVEFDAKWKIFLEGAKGRPERAEDDFSDSLFSERATTTEDGERTSTDETDKNDFSDCID